MRFVSTRGGGGGIPFSQAVLKGLADDGGLYIPDNLVKIESRNAEFDFEKDNYSKLAALLISPFVDGDELADELEAICERAFNFPIVLKYSKSCPNHAMLELFHGPTFAFKDFGARFLAECMDAILRERGERKLILVATSGDTGSAVGSAFSGKECVDVKILFPKGMVSKRQRSQLCSFTGNVTAYEVDGTFDDCQRMVKQAFMDGELNKRFGFSSANSINIARLLPQMTYYHYASLKFLKDKGRRPVVIVPTGNAGNVTAAYYALLMGAPIKRIVLACNANHSVTDYLRTGEYEGHETIKTLANAMDVGHPSNMERLMALFPSADEFRKNVSAVNVSDEQIRLAIRRQYDEDGSFICPHTACATYALSSLFDEDDDVICVSTASPVKFSDVIEGILGVCPPEDERFTRIISGEGHCVQIGADYHHLFERVS